MNAFESALSDPPTSVDITYPCAVPPAMATAMEIIMNPHFFYNTLNLIHAKAMQGACEDISVCCCSLAQITRYLSDGAKGAVDIAREITHVEAYLRIMKLRLGGRLHYAVQVSNSCLSVSIPKLAVFSACVCIFDTIFGNKHPPYRLELHGRKTDHTYEIRISINSCLDADIRELNSRWEQRCPGSAGPQWTVQQGRGDGMLSFVYRI